MAVCVLFIVHQLHGRREAALAEAKKAFDLDPLSADISNEYALALSLNGRNEEAMAQLQKSRELDADQRATPVIASQGFADFLKRLNL